MSTRSNRTNRGRPVRLSVAEGTAVLNPTARGERTAATETPTIVTEASKPGRLLVQLIKAGWSLNGRYYPAAVLKRDGARAFPKGTLNFVDHATDLEDEQRPAGSLRNLASYQTEDARWDETRQALVAEVRLFAPWRETVTDWANSGAVGMSIRAWVYQDDGEAEGRRGPIVTEFESGRSVDYVTVPAAGGAMLAVLEAAGSRTAAGVGEARNVGAWLESRLHLALTQLGDDMYGNGRLTRDERITLSSAIGDALKAWTARVESDAPQLFKRDIWDEPGSGETATSEALAAEATSDEMRRALTAAVRAAHGGDGVYLWLRDYDADEGVLWFDQSTEDTCTTWQQAYAVADDGTVTLTGDATQVVARIVYDPVTAGGDVVVGEQAAEAVTEQVAPAPTYVTDGAPPTAPTHPPTKETSVSGTQNTGPAPGAGGAAEGQSATNTATQAAEARAALAEQQLADANARLTALTEAQAKAASEKARADAAEAENRRIKADEAGRRAVVDAMAKVAEVSDQIRTLMLPRVLDRVAGKVPTSEDGKVDEAALGTVVDAAITAERTYAAALAESLGQGKVKGLGPAGEADAEYSDDATEAHLKDVFASIGLDEKTAELAAKGR